MYKTFDELISTFKKYRDLGVKVRLLWSEDELNIDLAGVSLARCKATKEEWQGALEAN